MPSIRQIVNLVRAWPAVRLVRPGLAHYVGELAAGRAFSFARYGDGEWSAILGDRGENVDGHAYSPELGEGLRHALCDGHGYGHAMQPHALRAMGSRIAAFVKEYELPRDWPYADVFHDANKEGALFPLVEQLRRMHAVLVGPEHLAPVGASVFPYERHIVVPSKNCFDRKDEIEREVLAHARRVSPGVVYLFSASMAANVIISDLFPSLGAHNWLLDMGSLWDIYVGVQSRGVYRALDWDVLKAKNLGAAPGPKLDSLP